MVESVRRFSEREPMPLERDRLCCPRELPIQSFYR